VKRANYELVASGMFISPSWEIAFWREVGSPYFCVTLDLSLRAFCGPEPPKMSSIPTSPPLIAYLAKPIAPHAS